MKGYFLGISSVIFITLSQLCLKAMIILLTGFPLDYQFIDIHYLFKHQQAFIFLFIGLIGYAISMCFWLLTLRFLELSNAYPLISISYVLVYLLAIILPFFNESATLINFIGIVFILVGICVIYRPKIM